MRSVKTVPLSAVLAAGCVVLAALFYTGIFCSDDTRYIEGITKIAAGELLSFANLAERRVLFLLPGAIVNAATSSIDATIAFYCVFYIALVILTWRTGAAIGVGRTGSFGAAALVATNPILLLNSGAIVPDPMAAAFSTASILLALRLLNRSSLPVAVACGASMAIAICVKESSAVIALLLPLLLLIAAATRLLAFTQAVKLSLGCFLGAVSIFLLEGFAFNVFFSTWHSSLLSSAAPPDFRPFMAWQGSGFIDRLQFFVGMVDLQTLVTILGAIFLGGYGISTLSRTVADRILSLQLSFLLLCFLWPLLYFTYGTTSLSEYIPPVMQARYYIPVLSPAAVVLFFGLERIRPKSLQIALTAVLTGIVLVSFATSYPYRGMAHAAQAKESYQLAMSEAAKFSGGLPVVNAGAPGFADFERCQALLWALPASKIGAADSTDVINLAPRTDAGSLPNSFWLIGQGNVLDTISLQGPLGATLASELQSGAMRATLMGYYYSDAGDADRYWWTTRERAVLNVAQTEPSWVIARARPRRQLDANENTRHAELYFVERAP